MREPSLVPASLRILRGLTVEQLLEDRLAGSLRTRLDAEGALFLVRGAADGKPLPRPPRNRPLVRGRRPPRCAGDVLVPVGSNGNDRQARP